MTPLPSPDAVSGRPAIRVTGLTKRFGDVRALRGIDLEVASGTVLGLLGPNGAGKTTVVRILTTILRADAGRAEVLGIDVAADRQRPARPSASPGSTRRSTRTSPAARTSAWSAA